MQHSTSAVRTRMTKGVLSFPIRCNHLRHATRSFLQQGFHSAGRRRDTPDDGKEGGSAAGREKTECPSAETRRLNCSLPPTLN
eukprot:46637-Amphidinium_carterae.2